MADTKKKGKLANRIGWGLVVLFAFAALVPSWIAWLAFWSLTVLGIASLVIYQRRRQVPWNDLLMDGDGAQKRTTRVAGGWTATLFFLLLASYVRLHLQEAEGALVALAFVSLLIWMAITGRFGFSKHR